MKCNLFRCSSSRLGWAALIFVCLLLEGVALYYQYQLDYLPCVLCIHVRMLITFVLVVACIGWLFVKHQWISRITLLATAAIWIWLSERSYQLLATERGCNMGECSMESGLPSWLALEQWFPWLFHIHEPCGYTPYILFQISTAEILIVMCIGFALFYTAAALTAFARKN